MTVLDGPARKPAESQNASQGDTCPECGSVYARIHPNQMFCTPVHSKAFNNRLLKRGQSLTPLSMAARITRGGWCGDTATGIKARQMAEQLIARYVAEDKAAGRMRMDHYVALRIRKGFTPP